MAVISNQTARRLAFGFLVLFALLTLAAGFVLQRTTKQALSSQPKELRDKARLMELELTPLKYWKELGPKRFERQQIETQVQAFKENLEFDSRLFIPTYLLLFLSLGACVWAAGPTFRALGALIILVALAAAVCDRFENLCALEFLKSFEVQELGKEGQSAAAAMVLWSRWKWALIFLAAACASPVFLPRKDWRRWAGRSLIVPALLSPIALFYSPQGVELSLALLVVGLLLALAALPKVLLVAPIKSEISECPAKEPIDLIFPMELAEIKDRRTAADQSSDGWSKVLKDQNCEKQTQTSIGAKGKGGMLEPLRKLMSRSESGAEETPYAGVKPNTRLGLLGVALSGGGIRSATFSLGALQALAERKVMLCVDYLSTVSGGGYLGCCLSSLLAKPFEPGRPEDFPLSPQPDGTDSPHLRHLRNSGRYLASGGMDFLRIPALLLRGILLHLFILLPYVVAAVWLTSVLFGDNLQEAPQIFYPPVLVAAIAFAGWVVFSPLIVLIRGWMRAWTGKDIIPRNLIQLSFAWLLAFTIVTGLACFLPTALTHYYVASIECGGSDFLDSLLNLAREQSWLAPAGTVLSALMAALGATMRSKALRVLALVGLALIGPLLLLWIYLELGMWGIYRAAPQWLDKSWLDWQWLDKSWHWLPQMAGGAPDGTWVAFSLISVAAFIYALFFVDMNYTSMHRYYRDRLSRAYMFQSDSLPLSGLRDGSSTAPYHLINASQNLPDTDEPGGRRRKADFFIFSKHFVGSKATGYCRTSVMERAHRPLDLATATAISGAAVAPNMGTLTIKPLVFLMALFNVRLGYWLPNPSLVDKSRLRRFAAKFGVGPTFLFREMFGQIDEASSFVNLSDGGHLENLGVYELLKRRCKYIIVCDGERDPDLNFGALAKLMRYAKIDLGIDIEIDLEELRKRSDGFSKAHCALGKVFYPPSPSGDGDRQVGYLVYIKSSLAGDEPESIREYRSSHEDFPHQSTGDQFFDEAQFESYRSLGYLAASSLFRGWKSSEVKPSQLEEWLKHLEDELRPGFPAEEAFVGSQKQLTLLEAALSDPDLAAYTYQIYPEISPSQPPRWSREKRRKIFHYCGRQMQLMENIFVELDLDKESNQRHHLNRGWMNLFRRWAEAPYFQWTWAVTIGTFSVGFQRFCETALGLKAGMSFKDLTAGDLTADEKSDLADLGLLEAEPYVGVQLSAKSRRETFRVGLCVVDVAPDDPPGDFRLKYCRIHKAFRRMGLFDRMLPELAKWLRGRHGKDARFKVSEKDISTALAEDASESAQAKRRNLRHILERSGFSLIKSSQDSQGSSQ